MNGPVLSEDTCSVEVTDGNIRKIVIAVHGVGRQRRCETVRSVARRFGDGCTPALPVLPLGYFSVPDGADVRWSMLETSDPGLSQIGFAELYWADIPNDLVRADDTLEDTKAWGRTLVSRAHALYRTKVANSGEKKAKLKDDDFQRGIEAIDTLVEGVAVLDAISKVAARVGLYKFELGCLLRDYVGDVQTVTEFPQYRNKILSRFHVSMNAIVTAFQIKYKRTPEIYIVAHSEGTVISLIAQLEALRGVESKDPDRNGETYRGEWIKHVKGFMTLGSPIDKHIALWPGLWKKFDVEISDSREDGEDQKGSSFAGQSVPHGQIKWRNYFDYGDPVGFRLDAASEMLEGLECGAFEFETVRHDFGYSRCWLPGAAHVSYWNDGAVFKHFIDTIVQGRGEDAALPPESKPACKLIAMFIPYALSFLLHLAAVFAVFAALSIIDVKHPSTLFQQARAAAALAALLATITVACRLPHLVRTEPRWVMLALGIYAVGAAVMIWQLPDVTAGAVGSPVAQYLQLESWSKEVVGLALLCAAGLTVIVVAWVAQQTVPISGRHLLIATGTIASLALALTARRGVDDIGLAQVTAYVAFVLLWWLGVILFDLALVWHRYIRNAVLVKMLRAWNNEEEAPVDKYCGLGGDPIQKKIDKQQKAKLDAQKHIIASAGDNPVPAAAP